MADEITKLDSVEFLELAHAGYENAFIKKGIEKITDVSADILKVVADIPYVGSLLKLVKLGGSICDLMFLRRIATFFEANRDLTDEDRDRFYNDVQKLSPEKRSKLADYLVSLIASVDNGEKATIMGWIYGDRVRNNIDTVMMLRLCSIVNRCFVNDLKALCEYQEVKVTSDYISTNLFSLGLLEDLGISSGSADDDGDSGGTRYKLNEVGFHLYRILKGKGWIV